VKAFHTRYRALCPELIPVYRQSARMSHQAGSRLPLLSARPAVTLPAADHHRPLASTKLYCLVTTAHRCEQLAQCCYAAFAPSRIWSKVQRSTRCATVPLLCATLSVHPHDISKTDAARITKLDTEMITMSTGNPFMLGSKGQRLRSRFTKTLPAWVFALLWVLAFYRWILSRFCDVVSTVHLMESNCKI